MPITSIVLSLDRTHYSRYELANATIQATVTAIGNISDIYTLVLRRRSHSAPREITSIAVVLANTTDTQTTNIDLTALQDADGFSPVRVSELVGDYEVEVSGDGQVATTALTIVPMTAEEFKSRWLRGLPLTQADRLAPRLQPQTLTGVLITDVGLDSKPGGNTLIYDQTAGTLRWQGGAIVTLDLGVTSYILADASTGFIEIVVTHASLPISNVTEVIFIEEAKMTDAEIVREILGTYREVEHGLQVFLEPTRIVTPRLLEEVGGPAWHDVDGLPVMFTRTMRSPNYIECKIPYRPILEIKDLSGWFNSSRVVQVGPEWRVHNEHNGIIQLIPTSGAVLIWVFSVAGLQSFLLQHSHVSNFWNYDVIAGFREIPPAALEYLAKRAAIKVLGQVGATRYPAGITSLSISRDGVSESRSLNPKGAYDAVAQSYASEIGRSPQGGQDREMVRLKTRLRGFSVVTVN